MIESKQKHIMISKMNEDLNNLNNMLSQANEVEKVLRD